MMYQATAHFYEFFNEVEMAKETEKRVTFLERYFKSDSPILDVGSGTGATAMALAERGHYVTCIEPSPDMQSLLLTKITHRRDISSRLTLLPLKAQNLDTHARWSLVYSFDVFFLMTSDADRDDFLRSIATHLESTGAFTFNYLRLGPKRQDKPLSQIGERKIGEVLYKHFSSAEQVGERERKVVWIFETWLEKKLLDRREEAFRLRVDSADEVIGLLRKHGFHLKHECAGVDESFVNHESAQALLVCGLSDRRSQ